MAATARDSSSNLENSFPYFRSLRGRRYLVINGETRLDLIVPDRDDQLIGFLEKLPDRERAAYDIAVRREHEGNLRQESESGSDADAIEPAKSEVRLSRPDF
jgi:hypothetical protein